MSSELRHIYALEGLRYIPQILTMVDQNPLSPTYGCGDRPFWLYKSIDYPCGMYGEFALPLALVYTHPFPDNSYQGQERIRELSLAVIRYQALSGHADGSCDDFYPYERAMGSTAFTLFAMAEAVHQLGVTDDGIISFLDRRAHWLARGREAGRLTNHHALTALGLAAVYRLTGEGRLKSEAIRIRDRVLEWQTEEGWFPEYEGFDPGYDTFTISFLAYFRRIMGDDTLTGPLLKAVRLMAELVGPDGSHAGEIGHRNSYHFVPHGFELLAPEMGEARYVADRFLAGASKGLRNYLDENRTFCHYQYNFLQSWLDFADRDRCPNWEPGNATLDLRKAGLIRVRGPRIHALVSVTKGGVLKASTKEGPIASDTGLVFTDTSKAMFAPARTGAKKYTLSQQGTDTVIEVTTSFQKIPNSIQSSTFKFLILRLLNHTVGRLSPNLLRRLIQYILINRTKTVPVELVRRITVGTDTIDVVDTLNRTGTDIRMVRLSASTDLTTIYTASSNSWNATRFFPWQDLEPLIDEFNETGRLTVSRSWTIPSK